MKKYFLSSFAAFLLATSASPALASQNWDDQFRKATLQWSETLKQIVNDQGGVDYRKLVAEHMAPLKEFIDQHAKIDPRPWSDEAKTAMYINLYNAGMIWNVLKYVGEQNIDLDSDAFLRLEVNKIRVPGGNIWSGNWKFNVHEHSFNLDELEHGLVRGQADSSFDPYKVKVLDPRIHAAVNCAAYSCPRLLQEAYLPETIDAKLQENMGQWLNNQDQFKRVSDTRMQANSIVMWYYEDFDDVARERLNQGGAGDYLASFIDDASPDADWMRKHLRSNFNQRRKLALRFSRAFNFEYDWRVADSRNLN